MHDSHRQRSKKLIQANPLHCAPGTALRRVQMDVDLRTVTVDVSMTMPAMLMGVRVNDVSVAGARRESVRGPLGDACEIQHPQEYQHQAHSQFHDKPNSGLNRQVKQNDPSAYEHNGDRVPQPPEYPNKACVPDTSLPAYNCRNGNDVIGVGSMAHSQQEPDRDDR